MGQGSKVKKEKKIIIMRIESGIPVHWKGLKAITIILYNWIWGPLPWEVSVSQKISNNPLSNNE